MTSLDFLPAGEVSAESRHQELNLEKGPLQASQDRAPSYWLTLTRRQVPWITLIPAFSRLDMAISDSAPG